MSHSSKQPDPTLQDNPAQQKAKQPAALFASPPASWALTPAFPGPLSCQEPALLSTYARMGSSISGKGGASTQARRSGLTFLNGPFGSVSISPGSFLHPGPRSRSGTSAPHSVGERERSGWVGGGWGERGPEEPSTKAFETLRSCRGLLRGDLVGVCCWLVCFIPHRARREERRSAASRKSTKILPQRPEASPPVQKYIPAVTDSWDPALGCRPPDQ